MKPKEPKKPDDYDPFIKWRYKNKLAAQWERERDESDWATSMLDDFSAEQARKWEESAR